MIVPILSGTYTTQASDYRISLPRNLQAVPVSTGANAGYLRPSEGIDHIGGGPGIDRGGINWRGTLYRVLGSKLCSISAAGAVTTLGDVGSDGRPVSLDYSFDRLVIWSNHRQYYWDGGALTQVTDVDLGQPIDGIWVAGYFMSTDGEFLVVTELNDPYSINPLKYGSSEADPDPVVGLAELRNEIYAFNRHTIEVFQNIGGDGFPFSRIEGAQVPRGALGTKCFTLFGDAFAMLGSGRNEAPSIYLVGAGQSVKLASREVDQILAGYNASQLAAAVLERKLEQGLEELWIRLPDLTLVYDLNASNALGSPVWSKRCTSVVGDARHLCAFPVFAYDRWHVSDPSEARLGVLTNEHSNQWGAIVGHEFQTSMLYAEGRRAIVHELELVALTGRTVLGIDPTIWTSYTFDGEVWSQERPIHAGNHGERLRRLCWRTQGYMDTTRVQRFRWTSETLLSVNRLEVALEVLMVRHG